MNCFLFRTNSMGDDGNGKRKIHAGVQGEGRQAVDRVARLVFVRTGRQDPGSRRRRCAVGATRRTPRSRRSKRSAEDAMAELKSLRAEVARLRRANNGVGRHGSTRHGVDGRLHRRIQGPFQGRADLQGAGRFVGHAVSSRRAATACSNPGPSAAWPPGTRRWPATSSRSMPISSWPCTGTARRTRSASAR